MKTNVKFYTITAHTHTHTQRLAALNPKECIVNAIKLLQTAQQPIPVSQARNGVQLLKFANSFLRQRENACFPYSKNMFFLFFCYTRVLVNRICNTVGENVKHQLVLVQYTHIKGVRNEQNENCSLKKLENQKSLKFCTKRSKKDVRKQHCRLSTGGRWFVISRSRT